MQVPALPVSASQRPLVLVTPGIGAHDEQPQRRLVRHPILGSLEPVVEPAQLQGLQVYLGSCAEIHVPATGRLAEPVRPWPDNELARSRRGRATVRAQSAEADEGLRSIQVVPAAHDVGWRLEVAPARVDVRGLPVLVIRRVLQPIPPERQVAPGRRVCISERQRPEGVAPVVVLDAMYRVAGGTLSPGLPLVAL